VRTIHPRHGPREITADLMELISVPPLEPRYNIAPTQPVATVLITGEAPHRELRSLRRGLMPHWAKDPGMGNRMINARAETAAAKPTFRAAFRERRCLILADGFYEWQKQPRGKQPFFIRMADAQPFASAGIWEQWEGPDGRCIGSCTILTTQPNDLLRPIHHRLGDRVRAEDYSMWLDPTMKTLASLEPLLRPYPAKTMTAYAVSTRVNSPARDDPGCVERI
jgi:putative SOS response-associated peptidase YedK